MKNHKIENNLATTVARENNKQLFRILGIVESLIARQSINLSIDKSID